MNRVRLAIVCAILIQLTIYAALAYIILSALNNPEAIGEWFGRLAKGFNQ